MGEGAGVLQGGRSAPSRESERERESYNDVLRCEVLATVAL